MPAKMARQAPAECSAAIFGCEGLTLTSEEKAFFRSVTPWGFILFARNVGDREEIARLVGELRDAAGWAAPVLIDQEGGRVARLRGPLWRDWPAVGNWCAAADEGAIAEDDLLEALRLRYRLTGQELLALGIDVDCAPLLDLRLPGRHEIMGDRALGATPESVGRRAQAIAQGLREAGVLPVIKHVPGHGRALVDSHHELPIVSEPHGTLSETDFSAFKWLKDEALGMTAHVVYSDLDASQPATLSHKIVGRIIRDEIGFDGLLMSDDLGMKALSGSEAEKARRCLDAGCDLVLHCSGVLTDMMAAADGLAGLSDEAIKRSARALAGNEQAGAWDEQEAEERLTELTGWTRSDVGSLGAPKSAGTGV